MVAMIGESTEDELLAEAVDWRLRLDAAPADKALIAALEAWLAGSKARRAAWRDVERMVRVAAGLPADYADRPPAVRMTASRAAFMRRRSVVLAAAALAVACLALFLLPGVQLWLGSDHRTATAELRTIMLDDGSRVSLGAESAIAVRYAAQRREVTLLSGRAFFEVVPASERPFVVVAGDARITVTGTAFDVRSSPGVLSVAVQSGTVEVALEEGRRLAATLSRGEQLEVDRKAGSIARSEVQPGDVAAWRERRLVVDRSRIADVVEEVGRHYAGVVVLRDRSLGNRLVSGVFDLNEPVEALQAAVRTHDGSIARITPYLVVISAP